MSNDGNTSRGKYICVCWIPHVTSLLPRNQTNVLARWWKHEGLTHVVRILLVSKHPLYRISNTIKKITSNKPQSLDPLYYHSNHHDSKIYTDFDCLVKIIVRQPVVQDVAACVSCACHARGTPSPWQRSPGWEYLSGVKNLMVYDQTFLMSHSLVFDFL